MKYYLVKELGQPWFIGWSLAPLQEFDKSLIIQLSISRVEYAIWIDNSSDLRRGSLGSKFSIWTRPLDCENDIQLDTEEDADVYIDVQWHGYRISGDNKYRTRVQLYNNGDPILLGLINKVELDVRGSDAVFNMNLGITGTSLGGYDSSVNWKNIRENSNQITSSLTSRYDILKR